jgi:PAS domain S-box-containing protein
MKRKMEQPQATNPNPMLSIGKDGTVIYSNEAGEPLLREWGARVGGKLPSSIVDYVQGIISRNSPKKMEVKVGKRVYLVVFHPLSEQECVNISGFDISDRKDLEEKLLEGEEKYRAIFDNSIDSVLLTSPDGTIQAANPAACQMFGMTEEEIIQAGRDGVVDTSDPRLQNFLTEGARIGKFKGELNYKRKGGTIFLGEISSTFFKDRNGIPKVVSIIRDISERKKTEETLRESEAKYRDLFETVQEVFYIDRLIYDEQGNVVDWIFEDLNPAGFELLGLKDLHEVKGKRGSEVLGREVASFYLPMIEKARRSSKAVTFQYHSPYVDKEFLTSYIVRGDRLISTQMDITERKQIENILHESESRRKVTEAVEAERRRLFDVLETLPVTIFLLTPDYHVAFANRRFREKFGESGNRHCYEYCYGRTKPCEFCESYKVLETGQPYHGEVNTPEGSVIDVYDFPFTDVDGAPMILEMGIDITERKKAEEALANVETARKKEIHHRIKNNLQVISSLLDLQAEKFNNRECIKDSEVLEAFRESQDRVISMALIHEELYKCGELETLEFSSYIEELADNLFLTYRLGNNSINLNMDVEEAIFFDLDTAIPLGMIVNELVSNSLKYAFKGKDRGEIRIKLHKLHKLHSEENGEFRYSREESKCEGRESTSFTLTVSDNGVGIPENLDIEELDSLGMQLVTSLVDQLDGELELKRNNGTAFIMRFTVTEKNNHASAPVSKQLF